MYGYLENVESKVRQLRTNASNATIQSQPDVENGGHIPSKTLTMP